MKISIIRCLEVVLLLLSICCIVCRCSRCEIARTKCAYRKGCGLSLHGYMVDCADLIAGRTHKCEASCLRALIALTSTDEGQELINCDCEGSKFCELNKERIQVCKSSVLAAMADHSTVSCTTARWICVADPLCSTALEYYNRFCNNLFDGHRCTHRCNNSLSILNRQEKAVKLRTCFCDGTEDFPCQRIQDNTRRLCFGVKLVYSVDRPQDNDAVQSRVASVLYSRTYLTLLCSVITTLRTLFNVNLR